MKLLATLLLALVACTAHAQSCVPKTSLTPNAVGTQLVTSRTPAGECNAYWCPGALLPNGLTQWSVKAQCVLDKYRNKAVDPLSIAKSVLFSTDPAKAIDDAIAAGTMAPVGAQETYDFAYLRWANCHTVHKPENMPPGSVPAADSCGPVPVQPPPTAAVWHTPLSGTYKLYTSADGKLTGNITGHTATANAVCDSSGPPAKSGTSTYYPLKGGPSTEFTLCVTP